MESIVFLFSYSITSRENRMQEIRLVILALLLKMIKKYDYLLNFVLREIPSR
jgi:hypothetical protein